MDNTITSQLKSIALGLVFVFGATTCTVSKSAPADTTVAEQEKSSVYKDLAGKYKQLFQQNQELRKMLQKLETDKQAEKEQNDKTIKQLTNTITLLELNFKQTNDRLAANTKQIDQLTTKQNKPVETTLLVSDQNLEEDIQNDRLDQIASGSDFKTPDSSKAIKTVPLVPVNKQTNTETTSNRTQKAPTSESNDAVTEKKDPIPVLTASTNSAWQDDDLVPPASPIQLKIVPGAKKNYQAAFKSYSNKDYKESIKQFGEFIKQYPNDLDADNSQYWIGAAYYLLEEYTNAESAFRKVLKNYKHEETKHGYKTPDAILMLGRIYGIRNQPIKSRYYFEDVVKRFPDSISAEKAKREIQSMSGF